MSQEPTERSQLDRIEGQLQHVDSQVGQVLQRMARVEERQDSQAAQVDSHRLKLEKHEDRIGSLELHQAVHARSQESDANRSDSRWSSAGAIGLVLLGAALSTAGYFALSLVGTTP